MAQGKLKKKSKLPPGAKIHKNKGKAVIKRNNAPVPIRSHSAECKKMIAKLQKMVNAKAKELIRALAKQKAAQRRVATAPTAPASTK